MQPDQNPCSLRHPPFPQTFVCQICGACCRWPGLVRLKDEDIRLLSAHLHLDPSDFVKQWTALAPDRRSLVLIEHTDGSCVFLSGNRCRVYAARPLQCRAFPLGWHIPEVEKVCPGVPTASRLAERGS